MVCYHRIVADPAYVGNWPIVPVHGPRRNAAPAAMRTIGVVGRMTEKGRQQPSVVPSRWVVVHHSHRKSRAWPPFAEALRQYISLYGERRG